jgi:hypothetical protein
MPGARKGREGYQLDAWDWQKRVKEQMEGGERCDTRSGHAISRHCRDAGRTSTDKPGSSSWQEQPRDVSGIVLNYTIQ